MNEELDVWSLIKNGQFEKACVSADEEYENTAQIFPLRNKVYALFNLRRYADVISLCEKLIEIEKGESSGDFLHLGIAHWIIGNTELAIDAWQRAQNSIYKDAAGGIDNQVFLYFASIKIGQDKLKSTAIKTIKKLLKSKRSINYPGPLGYYLINDINENELIDSVSKVPILKERELAEAYFVLAIKRLEADDLSAYYENLKKCVNYGRITPLGSMYYMAKGVLEMIP